MDIDPDIANWVLEFFLRQPVEDRVLNSLLRALPLPNNNPHLQKSLLLKKLESEVSGRLVSETTLELLEQLEEIEFRQGNEAVSDTMKRTYCAVAVDCTLKLLKAGGEDGKFKFFEMVKRVWRGRIGRMEKVVEKGGLGSDLLWAWKDEIEAAVWDDSVCDGVLKKFEGVQAEEAVRVYLREEREKMGPSFLELVAERVKNDEGLQEILGVNGIDLVASEETHSRRVDRAMNDRTTNGSNASKELHKGKIKLRDKLVGVRRPRGLASGSSRGAKLVDSDETARGPSCRNYSSPRSAEVSKAREALELSSMELRAVVKDPLPDALRVAEAISGQARQDKNQDPAKSNDGRPNLFIVDVAGVVQSSDNTKNVPRPSLMERNRSARSYEWDESIDGSQEDIACRAVLQLSTPKRINTSPLKLYDINNLKKRRKGRRWSLLEEDTLRAGVEKYGKGNWKVILTVYQDVFEGRTEVDLKDKWRNLTR
ncbi:hypothetical protein C2S51_023492 [Perilla frutescens var. frutescens]|nr:hypothetical protein C2S51_023492 [Perilla frutescens var. frutescens]